MGLYYYLTPVLGGPSGPHFPIAVHRQVIGRAQEAEIVLAEPTVSREHAAIHCEQGVVHLQDLGSRHGTFVNSRRITTAQLKTGDLVVFGLSLALRLEQSSRALAATPTQVAPGEDGVTLGDARNTRRRTTSAHHELRPRVDAAGTLSPRSRIRWFGPALHQLASLGAACTEALPALERSLEAALATLDQRPPPQHLQAELQRELLGAQERLRAVVACSALRGVAGQPLALLDTVRAAVNELAGEAARHHVQFELGIPLALQVRAHPGQLRGALTTLLANAVLSSPPGATITVEARLDGGEVVLMISDVAAPVPPDVRRALADPTATLEADWQPLALSLLAARYALLPLAATVELGLPARGAGRCVRISLPLG
ncbi:MAG: FHA domain-containing protein [Proteobacteria bacterium]|nr:FHA domain-containing protein [Pseudomonadota bacterium]